MARAATTMRTDGFGFANDAGTLDQYFIVGLADRADDSDDRLPFIRMTTSLALDSSLTSSGEAASRPHAPRVSLVIAWAGSSLELGEGLESLEGAPDPRCEVVVVRPSPVSADLRRSVGRLGGQVVEASPDASCEDLRSLGTCVARGDVVLVRDRVAASDLTLVRRLVDSRGNPGSHLEVR